MKRHEICLISLDSVTVDGVTFVAVQPFVARIPVCKGERLITTMDVPKRAVEAGR